MTSRVSSRKIARLSRPARHIQVTEGGFVCDLWAEPLLLSVARVRVRLYSDQEEKNVTNIIKNYTTTTTTSVCRIPKIIEKNNNVSDNI